MQLARRFTVELTRFVYPFAVLINPRTLPAAANDWLRVLRSPNLMSDLINSGTEPQSRACTFPNQKQIQKPIMAYLGQKKSSRLKERAADRPEPKQQQRQLKRIEQSIQSNATEELRQTKASNFICINAK